MINDWKKILPELQKERKLFTYFHPFISYMENCFSSFNLFLCLYDEWHIYAVFNGFEGCRLVHSLAGSDVKILFILNIILVKVPYGFVCFKNSLRSKHSLKINNNILETSWTATYEEFSLTWEVLSVIILLWNAYMW